MPLVSRTVRPLAEIKSVEDLIAELESIELHTGKDWGEKATGLDVVVEHELPFFGLAGVGNFFLLERNVCF